MVYFELQIVDDIVDDFDVLAGFRSSRKNKRVAIRVTDRFRSAIEKRIVFNPHTLCSIKDHAAIGHDAIRIKRQVGNHDIAGCFDRCDSSSAGFLVNYRFCPSPTKDKPWRFFTTEFETLKIPAGK